MKNYIDLINELHGSHTVSEAKNLGISSGKYSAMIPILKKSFPGFLIAKAETDKYGTLGITIVNKDGDEKDLVFKDGKLLESFKNDEMEHELGHESNNIAIMINDKIWKVIAGGRDRSPQLNKAKATADKIVKTLKDKGKKASWVLSSRDVSESVEVLDEAVDVPASLFLKKMTEQMKFLKDDVKESSTNENWKERAKSMISIINKFVK